MGWKERRDSIVAEIQGSGAPQQQPRPTSAWERRKGETEERYRNRIGHYAFMAYDPDNPDIPLD